MGEEGHKKLLETELSLNYQKEDKYLVDACLYFVAPTGHGLKELDIEFMKMLSEKVNIVPVIAKADAFLAEELGLFKQNILRQLLGQTPLLLIRMGRKCGEGNIPGGQL